MDRRRNWRFVMDENGRWLWMICRAEQTEQVSATFATLKECIADAREHGYVAWRAEEERRRELQLDVAKALSKDTR